MTFSWFYQTRPYTRGIYFTIFYAMTEKTHNEELNEKKATKVPVENEEESDLWSLPTSLILLGASGLSFWWYANNYIISIRRLSLGEYSCLIIGIILALLGLYSLYLYFQKKKEEKAGK